MDGWVCVLIATVDTRASVNYTKYQECEHVVTNVAIRIMNVRKGGTEGARSKGALHSR